MARALNPSKPKTSRSAPRAAFNGLPAAPGRRSGSPDDDSVEWLDRPGGSLPSSVSGRRYARSIRRGSSSGPAHHRRRAAPQSAFPRPFAAHPGQSNPDLRHRPVDEETRYPQPGESWRTSITKRPARAIAARPRGIESPTSYGDIPLAENVRHRDRAHSFTCRAPQERALRDWGSLPPLQPRSRPPRPQVPSRRQSSEPPPAAQPIAS